MIGKRVARRAIVLPAAYYALHALAGATHPVPTEMMLAIARRESEFDPSVVSGAGARGLMQLMPGTAKEVAGDLGLAYSALATLDGYRQAVAELEQAHQLDPESPQILVSLASVHAERKKAGKAKGAKVMPSGLIYTEISEGSGKSPGPTDTVKVHYHGTLRDGTVFDSSVQRGTPAEFPLNRVIACWTEGVGMMKEGGKSTLICPPEIAYGDRGNRGIKGGSVLTFEVELLEIVE